MRFQSWPDIGFWPSAIIVFFCALFFVGFALEGWLGMRINEIWQATGGRSGHQATDAG